MKNKPTILFYDELSATAKEAVIDRYRAEEILNMPSYPSFSDLFRKMSEEVKNRGISAVSADIAEHFRQAVSTSELERHIRANEFLFNEKGDFVEVRVVNL
jgi:3-methyladenine DNA glycosylase Tag